MAPQDDGELLVRYAQGDIRAFEVLYGRHRAPLYRYLVRHTRNAETASDLFQEVWSRVILGSKRYEPRAQFRTFLFRIAHNCFIDHCRRTATRTETSGDGDSWETNIPAPEHERPDTRAEHDETLARYRAALAALPQEQRDVFLLYEESGLSLEEIAAITAVGTETAKSRLRYAVAKLRAALARRPDEPAANMAPVQERGT